MGVAIVAPTNGSKVQSSFNISVSYDNFPADAKITIEPGTQVKPVTAPMGFVSVTGTGTPGNTVTVSAVADNGQKANSILVHVVGS